MLNEKEQNNRNKLKEIKPRAYEKIIKNSQLPIIQHQYRYDCNLVCKHCSIQTIKLQNKNNNKHLMTLEDVAEFSRQADEIGIARWEINGGEPLVNQDLGGVISAINSSKYYMNLVTNGYLLTPDMAIWLKKKGIDRVQVGIDSLDQKEHDTFRRRQGSHHAALNAVMNCQNIGLDVFVTTVVTSKRLFSDEFIRFIEYFNAKNIGVFMTFAKPVGAWSANYDIMVQPDHLDYIKILKNKYNIFSHLTPGYENKGGCLAFRGLIACTPYGDILPCQYLFISLGNVLKEPLKDILARGMRLKPFKTHLCPVANDKNFVEKYITKTYNKQLPVDYKEIFSEEDFEF